MQKRGKIEYDEDEEEWVGSHLASKKEAKALNLLKLFPIDPSKSMTTSVYKDINNNSPNFNGSIKEKFIIG